MCIVQDDKDDFTTEFSRLESYISHADVVFAATAEDADGSLFRRHKTFSERDVDITAHMEVGTQNTFPLTLRRPVQTAAAAIREEVLHRAWRIQEIYLARRVVVFGREQIYWNCGALLRSESSAITLPPVIQGVSALSLSLKSRRSFGVAESARLVYEAWYKLAETLSCGELSFEADRLASTAGLRESFRNLKELCNDEYFEGLWKGDLAHGLLWLNDKQSKTQEAVLDLTGQTRSLGPTWSWPSNRGPISYTFTAGLKAEQALKFPTVFTVVNSSVYLENAHPYQMERVAHLDVSALCKRLHVPNSTELIQYFFDVVPSSTDRVEEWEGYWLMIVAPGFASLAQNHIPVDGWV